MAQARYCVRLEQEDMDYLRDYLPARKRNQWIAEWVSLGVQKLREAEAKSLSEKELSS